MRKLLQIHFNFDGPFGSEMAAQLRDLAESINQEPGFLWKVWTENQTERLAGGVYAFKDEQTLNAYVKKHSARLEAMGVSDLVINIFDINETLTAVNHGN